MGSFLVVAAFVLLYAKSMKLNPPKKTTFWAAVIIEAVGIFVYVAHLFPQSLPIMDVMGFLLFVTAFILLWLTLILKGL